uniref:DNA primase n=1 Tax=Percolomonas cosmopolitus TaxID=63605 RepID=A0A7S1KTT3_9EUKA
MDPETHHSKLKKYYKTLFPIETLVSYYTCSNTAPLSHREFSFTRGDIYMRYKSFQDCASLKKSLLQIIPHKIDIGAIYNQDPSYKSSDLSPIEKEFCVDIDISDYDDIRTCCKGASLCHKCWPLMHSAIDILNFAFREWFAFESILWVFSGRRGIHGWVNDERVIRYNHQERSAVAEFIHLYASNQNNKSKIHLSKPHPMFDMDSPLFAIAEKWFIRIAHDLDWIHNQHICQFISDEEIRQMVSTLIEESQVSSVEMLWDAIKDLLLDQKKVKSGGRTLIHEIVYTFVYPRLDINVSKQTHHLLKSPFVVHPKTGLVCMAIPDDEVLRFDPDSAPSLDKLLDKDPEAMSIFERSVQTFEKHATRSSVARKE